MALFKQYHFVLRPGQIVEGKSLVSDKTYRGRSLQAWKILTNPRCANVSKLSMFFAKKIKK